jgi:hypothetical protein
MKRIHLIALLLLFEAVGCNRNPGAVAQVSVEQIPTSLKSAFGKASPEVQSMADEAVSALQSQDAPKTFLDLRDLCARPDLTPDQRAMAAGAMVAMSKKLRADADQGDTKAAEFLKAYMSTR